MTIIFILFIDATNPTYGFRYMTKLQHGIANIAILLSVIGTGVLGSNAYAQNNISNPSSDLPGTNPNNVITAPSLVTTLRTSEINGDITKVDGGKITILDGSGKAYEYTLNDSIRITRDTNIAKSNDIKVGDKVKIIIDADKNSLIGLEATNGQVFDIAKFGIPLIVLAVVVVGLIIYIINKSKEGKILTASDSSNP